MEILLFQLTGLETTHKFKRLLMMSLLAVMVHGLLHFMGLMTSSEEETLLMRDKEDDNLKMFHVEQ